MPFHDSTKFVLKFGAGFPLCPPANNAAVLVPALDAFAPSLAVFKSFTSVQLVPFQVSVLGD